LKEPCRILEIFYPDRLMFGDAVLITDRRMHWVLSIVGLPEDDLRDFAAMLTTPWHLQPHRWCSELIFLEPIREVWVPDQRLGARRLSMRRIMASRTKAAALRAYRS
jgi:hypothetical protein